MANERICIVCGTQYEYCPKCAKYAHLPKWMWMVDTETCKDLNDVIVGYSIGNKTIDDVKQIVAKHNITDYSKYSKGVQNVLNKISLNSEVIDESVEEKSTYNKKNKKNKWFKPMDIELNETKETTEDFVVTEAVIEGISEE